MLFKHTQLYSTITCLHIQTIKPNNKRWISFIIVENKFVCHKSTLLQKRCFIFVYLQTLIFINVVKNWQENIFLIWCDFISIYFYIRVKLKYNNRWIFSCLLICIICFAGIKFCGNRRISHILNLLWGLVYSICGATQFIAGIYFMLDLPIFQLGSNIWTGAWVRNL